MKKLNTLKFDNKMLLIAGIIVILLALGAWGFLAQRQGLHDAPRAVLTPLSNLDQYKPDRFIPHCDPLRDKCEEIVLPDETIKFDNAIKFDEPIKTLDLKTKKSYR